MKRVLTGIFLVIDIVLLIVIVSSLIKPKDKDTALNGEKYEVSKESTKKVGSEAAAETKKDKENAQNSESTDNSESTEKPGNAENMQNPGNTENMQNPESTENPGNADAPYLNIDGIEDMSSPELSDFMWYYDGVYYNGVPDDAELLFAKDELRGAWKAFFWFGHDPSGSYDAMEFANLMLTPGDNTVEVSVKMCRLYIPESEYIDETDDPIHTYSGTWDENGVFATGAGNIIITSFYERPDGHQYAIGTFEAPDGTPTVIALTRP